MFLSENKAHKDIIDCPFYGISRHFFPTNGNRHHLSLVSNTPFFSVALFPLHKITMEQE